MRVDDCLPRRSVAVNLEGCDDKSIHKIHELTTRNPHRR